MRRSQHYASKKATCSISENEGVVGTAAQEIFLTSDFFTTYLACYVCMCYVVSTEYFLVSFLNVMGQLLALTMCSLIDVVTITNFFSDRH